MKLAREVKILQEISHKFIVEMRQVIETETHFGLVMEVATGSSLSLSGCSF